MLKRREAVKLQNVKDVCSKNFAQTASMNKKLQMLKMRALGNSPIYHSIAAILSVQIKNVMNFPLIHPLIFISYEITKF